MSFPSLWGHFSPLLTSLNASSISRCANQGVSKWLQLLVVLLWLRLSFDSAEVPGVAFIPFLGGLLGVDPAFLQACQWLFELHLE